MSDNDSLKREVGIKCLNCGLSQFPPNREMHNWSCSNCFSGFISIVMLTNLVTRDLIDAVKRKQRDRPVGRDCVMCHQAMEIVEAAYQGKDAKLEYCRHCHLCWFDSGEMGRVLRRKPADSRILSDEEIARLEADGVPRHRRKTRNAPTERKAAFPVATITIFALAIIAVPLFSQSPALIERFGLLPSAPFRLFGATWFTSLFVADSYSVNGLVILAVLGTFIERRVGTRRFFDLFVLSGIAGRIGYCVAGIDRETILIGAAPSYCGVLAYAALSLPLRDFFVGPKERWRHSGAGAWWAVGIGGVIMVSLGWDYILMDMRRTTAGISGVSFSGTHIGQLLALVTKPTFRGYLAAATVALLWKLGETGRPRQKMYP